MTLELRFQRLKRCALTPKRHAFAREVFILTAFLLLTLLMTWPWALHLRDAIPDPGDPYAHAYFLWWDYHQTFHDPVHLFEATIFYPYHDTLAFSESDYGIALLFFPLFALGLRPLTIEILATLLGFAFTAYGAFRLARTLGLRGGAPLVAAIVFAFVPYRFNQLSHLPIIFTGWIPLLMEALVLFARERSWRRASWLGAAFLMNALTCLTWFVLTAIPLLLSAIFLLARYRLWRERAFWLRAFAALSAAMLVLSPFLLAYYRVSRAYGFIRSRAEVAEYSAHLINWLAAEERNKLWHGLGVGAIRNEMVLFPGLLPLLLALAALLLVERKGEARLHESDTGAPRLASRFMPGALVASRSLTLALDAVAVLLGICALLAAGYGSLNLSPFDSLPLRVVSVRTPLILLALTVCVRCVLAPTRLFRAAPKTAWANALRTGQSSEALALALIWALTGFLGSFGLNSFFHRALYEYVPLFRSMRVAARWSMIAYLGLALLAGIGARRLASAVAHRWPRMKTALPLAVIILSILFEQRVAPMQLIRGEADPDEMTLRLKRTPMSGGLVELPAGPGRHLYTARAADHAKPFVTAIASFVPPVGREVESLSRSRPVPDKFLDLLESIPASYLVIHNASLYPESRVALEDFLSRGVSAGRLVYIRSYGAGRRRTDLYAVARTEPQARSEGPMPPPLTVREITEGLSDLPARFRDTGFFIYRLYKASYGRMPLYAEFLEDLKEICARDAGERCGQQDPSGMEGLEAEFADAWVRRAPFRAAFDGRTDEQYVDALFANMDAPVDTLERDSLVRKLKAGTETRASLLRKMTESRSFILQEFNSAFVLMHYFAYLRRDPEPEGHKFWLSIVDSGVEPGDIHREFVSSREARARLDE